MLFGGGVEFIACRKSLHIIFAVDANIVVLLVFILWYCIGVSGWYCIRVTA